MSNSQSGRTRSTQKALVPETDLVQEGKPKELVVIAAREGVPDPQEAGGKTSPAKQEEVVLKNRRAGARRKMQKDSRMKPSFLTLLFFPPFVNPPAWERLTQASMPFFEPNLPMPVLPEIAIPEPSTTALFSLGLLVLLTFSGFQSEAEMTSGGERRGHSVFWNGVCARVTYLLYGVTNRIETFLTRGHDGGDYRNVRG